MISKKGKPSLGQEAFKILLEKKVFFQRELNQVQLNWSPDSIHDVRVACRRIRSALRAFSPFLEPVQTGFLAKAMRDFMRELNSLRDLDVQIELLNSFERPIQRNLKIEVERILEIFQNRKIFFDQKLQDYVKENLAIIQIPIPKPNLQGGISFRESVKTVLEPEILEASRRLGEVNWEKVEGTPKPLHSLRIQFKRVRYGIELFQEFLGKEVGKLLGRFKDLQDLLGWIHDCDVLAGELLRILRNRFKERYETARLAIKEFKWPEINSRVRENLKAAEKRVNDNGFFFFLEKISHLRMEHFQKVRKALQRFERMDWKNSLPDWFGTGKCNLGWRKELSRDENR